MSEVERSKIKMNIILTIIGIIIALACFLIEILLLKMSGIFWLILLICDIAILIINVVEYKK